MKWFILIIFVAVFPVLVLVLGSDFGSLTKVLDHSVAETTSDPLDDNRVENSTATEIDLRAASSATIKKINEIEKKIDSAKEDLRKNESAKQAVIKDLLKIQAKINSIIKSESNL